MSANAVRELIERDRWTAVQGDTPAGPYVLRHRTPVLPSTAVGDHPRCLRVLWPYGEEGCGSMPAADVSRRMAVFEDRLCDAWESDSLAVLTAVLTFDGARQWVFYTADAGSCGQRLNGMPQEPEPYPIELDVFDDPEWAYLRNDVVGARGGPTSA